MLKIHKPFSKHKLLIIPITSICITFGLVGLSALTYTPELSHAETATYRSLDDITYMQDMTAEICKHSQENETKQLIDSRDGKTYWVTKLKDGNCWMTQNLDLDILAKGLSRNDTDIPVDWNSSSTYKPVATQTTASPNFTSNTNDVQSWDPALGGKATYCNDDGVAGKCKNSDNSTTSINNGHDAQGNYYSWGAATAGQAASFTTDGVAEATQSICPKGWQLPVNSGDKSYGELLTSYGVNSGQDISLKPLYFIYGGRVMKSPTSLNGTGSSGFYWSSIGIAGTNAFSLVFHTNNVNPSDFFGRYLGYSIRCVARTNQPETRTLANIEYMQDITADICANTPEATADGKFQYQLKDSRDQKDYWVAKLKDGNCWMTQNLALNITKNGLSADNTDIQEDWNASSAYPPEQTLSGTGRFKPINNVIGSYDPGKMFCFGDSCGSSSSNYGHDSIGYFYSWGAATAGQAATLTSDTIEEQATQSICPKNWSLPTSSAVDSLFSSYGEYQANSLLYGNQNIMDAPLYYIKAGRKNPNGIGNPPYYLEFIGKGGLYWSATAVNSSKTYMLAFSDTKVDPFNDYSREMGASIRCVSMGSKNYQNIEITVNPQLSIDITNEVVVEESATNPSTVNLDAKVSSNQKYSLGISATNPNLTSTTTDVTIPAKTGLLNTAENGWGIKLKDDTEFTALTTDLQTFYTASGAEIKTTTFTIGVSTAPDLANGEYSTDIIVTATQN